MSIYTKKGDKGQTSLIDGRRVSKASAIPHAVGTVDELNAHIGMARALVSENMEPNSIDIKDIFTNIQEDLFVIGSYLAGNKSDLNKLEKHITKFEQGIDILTAYLPELKNFILPGGSTVGAQLHICRTVCRRAERMVVEVEENETILKYLNRLSDMLFMAARAANNEMGVEDVIWKTKPS